MKLNFRNMLNCINILRDSIFRDIGQFKRGCALHNCSFLMYLCRFGATYVGTMLSPTDVKTLMVGDIDPSGNLNANVIHQWNQRLKSKFMGQVC